MDVWSCGMLLYYMLSGGGRLFVVPERFRRGPRARGEWLREATTPVRKAWVDELRESAPPREVKELILAPMSGL